MAAVSLPETPEYFQEVTGIELCPMAEIRNVNLDQASKADIGFIYQVELRFDDECSRSFEHALRRRKLPPGEIMIAKPIGDHILFSYAG